MKPNAESENETKDWDSVSAAAKFVMERDAGDEEAPFGFSTRVVSQWLAARREQAMILWQRWSVRAAVCSVVLAAVVVFASRRDSVADDALLFSVPTFDVPVPADKN